MKKIFFALLVTIGLCNATHAQQLTLTNTSWKGIISAQNDFAAILTFSKDTFQVAMAEENVLIETMSYSLKGDTLTVRKIAGGSPCDDTTIGTYKIAIKNDIFYITVITDECMERSMAFSAAGYKK